MKAKQFWYALETADHGRTFHTVFAADSDSAWDLAFDLARGVDAMDLQSPFDPRS